MAMYLEQIYVDTGKLNAEDDQYVSDLTIEARQQRSAWGHRSIVELFLLIAALEKQSCFNKVGKDSSEHRVSRAGRGNGKYGDSGGGDLAMNEEQIPKEDVSEDQRLTVEEAYCDLSKLNDSKLNEFILKLSTSRSQTTDRLGSHFLVQKNS